MKNHSLFFGFIMLLGLNALGQDNASNVKSENNVQKIDDANKGVQMTFEIAPVEKPMDLNYIPLRASIQNSGVDSCSILMFGQFNGLYFYTVDGQNKIIDIKDDYPIIDSANNTIIAEIGSGALTDFPPGAKKIITVHFPVKWLARVEQRLYAALSINDANGKNSFQISSPGIDISLLNDFAKIQASKAKSTDSSVDQTVLQPKADAPSSSSSTNTIPLSTTLKSTKEAPLLAQVESASYIKPVIFALGVLVVVGFLFRIRK